MLSGERFYLFACSSAVSHYYFTVVHLSVLDGFMWTWVPKYFVHNCLQLMTLKHSLKFQNYFCLNISPAWVLVLVVLVTSLSIIILSKPTEIGLKLKNNHFQFQKGLPPPVLTLQGGKAAAQSGVAAGWPPLAAMQTGPFGCIPLPVDTADPCDKRQSEVKPQSPKQRSATSSRTFYNEQAFCWEATPGATFSPLWPEISSWGVNASS